MLKRRCAAADLQVRFQRCDYNTEATDKRYNVLAASSRVSGLGSPTL
jgi:hypothetical protein